MMAFQEKLLQIFKDGFISVLGGEGDRKGGVEGRGEGSRKAPKSNPSLWKLFKTKCFA